MLSGSIVALVTPMAADGAVHWQELDALIDWHIASGTAGIVPMGTTGESATLEVDEHLQVIEATIKRVAGRVPVIAGTGANSTAEAIHQTQEAQRLGADACLLVTPYYNRPTQAGLVAHFTAIAEATEVPLVLYNVPPRTACDMLPATVAEVARLEQVIGIKEACGDPERVAQLRAVVDSEFVILSGEDAQTMRMAELGAVGTISVSANVVPQRMAEFCAAFLAGDLAGAKALDAKLQGVHDAMFVESSPQPVKWALQQMGKISPGIRLPLLPLSEPNQPVVKSALVKVGAL